MVVVNQTWLDFVRILRLIWNAGKRIAIINVALQVALSVLPAATLYLIKEIIDSLTKGDGDFRFIVMLVISFGILQLLMAAITQYAVYINAIQEQKLTDSLAEKVLDKAISVDYAYYENPAYHDTLHLAQLQSLYKAPALLSNFNTLLLNSLSLIFLAAVLAKLSPLFALLAVGLSLPLAIVKWYSGFALLKLERQFAPMEREAGYLHHTLTNVSYAKEVRVFDFGRSFIQKFNTIRQHIFEGKRQLNIRYTVYSLIAEVIEVVVMVFIFLMLAKNTWEKAITVGVFVFCLQGFQRLQANSKSFLQALVQLFQQRFFLQDLFAFLSIESDHEPVTTSFPQGTDGLLVKDISFTYPQSDREVLHNISIECKPGQIIAIVGENGSGKSTLVKLLAQLYQLQSGDVSLNGLPINEIDLGEYRRDSVFLFQDFEKYFLTIEENIALGEALGPEAKTSIQNAAKLSGAHDFITRLSKGYQTRMGRLFEGSEQISGGQWQKLALSRLFYKNARLLVLDEPTSALDAQAELEVFSNIKKTLGDKMVIIITHRLYNLKMADHIYVMQNGSITEHGSFEELVTKNGAFTALYDAQKL